MYEKRIPASMGAGITFLCERIVFFCAKMTEISKLFRIFATENNFNIKKLL